MPGASASAPRPLQLASGSVVQSSGWIVPSDSPSCNALASSAATGTSSTQMAKATFSFSGSGPGLEALQSPPRMKAMKRQSTSHSRQKSSISYIHSESNSPSFRSVDTFIKSPLSASHKPASSAAESQVSFSELSNSVNGTIVRNSVGSTKPFRTLDRSSTGSFPDDPKVAEFLKNLRERPPVTLAEKHAELLHFIAQKESKCLELRSQLTMHEAELLQLKRKWERIINRGFDKSPTLSPTSQSLHSPLSPTTPHESSSHSTPSPYFPLVSPIPSAHTPMLEGIKEGVQGVSRFIAAGLESIAAGSSSSSHLMEKSSSSQLVTKSNKKGSRQGHGQNESQSSSSSSTAISISTTASTSSDSRTNATSIESFSLDDTFISAPTKSTPLFSEQASDADPVGVETQDLLGFRTPQDEQLSTSSPLSDRSEQVLMVHDTGATPTMSPNFDFERKRMKERKRRGNLNGSPPARRFCHKSEVDFDAWQIDISNDLSANLDNPSKPNMIGQHLKSAPKSPPSLAPMSSIPGLATIGMAPTTQQLSSWVGNMGKKLGDLKGNTTFAKNQKRASLLLSDMQNSLVSALISPMALPVSSGSLSVSNEKRPASATAFSSNSSTSRYHSDRPSRQLPRSSASLLDDSDSEADFTIGVGNSTKTAVLVPSPVADSPLLSVSGTKSIQSTKLEKGNIRSGVDTDDEWNW